MLTIEVNFLTGRYVATAHHDRTSPEWPPHPARLFSALVATWADSDDPDPRERQALEWLESQPPPSIRASEATPRSTATHFVPVNDARIFSQRSYDNRARRIEVLLAEINEARSRGTTQTKLTSLDTKLRKQQDVSQMISSVGNTPVRSAVNIMPPGWMSTSKDVRTGQARSYPSVTPTEPRVTYVWNTEPADAAANTIDGLCARLTRLGHSSSLVSCRVVQEHPHPSYVPGVGGEVLRSVRSGQLAALEREFEKHLGSRPRILPFTPVRYRKVETSSADHPVLQPDTAGEWLVTAFVSKSRKYPSIRTVDIARALRGAIFHHAADPLPEGLSGHRRDGTASSDPHVGFLPLPWVAHKHADGRLMGVAISMPESLDTESRRALLHAVGRWESARASDRDPLVLTLGKRGTVEMVRVVGTSSLVTLRPAPWRRASRRWLTATPIALPAHPGPLGKGTAAARSKAWARAEQAIVDSCHHIGLPEPTEVVASLAPLIPGARPAPSFPAFHQPGRGGKPVARRLVHASVGFEDPVVGPMVLGAGRYLGLGLMRPMDDGGGE